MSLNSVVLLSLQTMLTAISMSAIATNGVVPGKTGKNKTGINSRAKSDECLFLVNTLSPPSLSLQLEAPTT